MHEMRLRLVWETPRVRHEHGEAKRVRIWVTIPEPERNGLPCPGLVPVRPPTLRAVNDGFDPFA